MHNHLKIAEELTNLLENRFKFLGLRFGLDPIIGFVPGFGDALAALLSLYIVWIGVQMRLPGDKIALMLVHILIDFLVGIIPIIGDVSDFVYKSNSKNLALLKSHNINIIHQTTAP